MKCHVKIMDQAIYYEPTSEQVQSYLYHSRLGEKDRHQLLLLDFTLTNPDMSAIEYALRTMIGRHDSLRTFFRLVDGNIRQCVVPYSSDLFRVSFHDLRNQPDKDDYIQQILSDYRTGLRALNEPPLFKHSLFRTDDDTWYYCLLIHHLIADEWSMTVINKELAALYEAFKNGQPDPLPPLQLQVPGYAAWQKQWLAQNREPARSYWHGKLNALESKSHLWPVLNHAAAALYVCHIEEKMYSRLQQASRNCSASIAAILCVVLKLMFYILAGKRKALLAMPVINRYVPGTEDMIGCLGGSVYLYKEVDPLCRVKDFVKDLYLEFLRSTKYLIYDHDDLMLKGGTLRANCDVFVNFLNKKLTQSQKPAAPLQAVHTPLEAPEYYAFSNSICEYENGIVCYWKYNTSLYNAERIDNMAALQQQLLDGICDYPNNSIEELAAYITRQIPNEKYSTANTPGL